MANEAPLLGRNTKRRRVELAGKKRGNKRRSGTWGDEGEDERREGTRARTRG
jgi:hypothetical protein